MCTACIQARESRSPSGRPPPPGGVAQQAHAHDRILPARAARGSTRRSWPAPRRCARSSRPRSATTRCPAQASSASQRRARGAPRSAPRSPLGRWPSAFFSARLHSKRTVSSRRMMPGARDENSRLGHRCLRWCARRRRRQRDRFHRTPAAHSCSRSARRRIMPRAETPSRRSSGVGAISGAVRAARESEWGCFRCPWASRPSSV